MHKNKYQSSEAYQIPESEKQHNIVEFRNLNCHTPLHRSYTSIVNLIEHHQKLVRSKSEPATRYKTELCRPFEENGTCKYGDKCQFAHGYHELRNLDRHPKYKTELCRTFHKTGFCPYGPRCHFVHNFEEARVDRLKLTSTNFSHNLNPLLQPIHVLQQPTIQLQTNTILTNTDDEFSHSTVLSRTLQQPTQVKINQELPQSNFQSIFNRPKPLSLSPTLSLGSAADSISPTSSLSQSPTNSMGHFFSDEITYSVSRNHNSLSLDKQNYLSDPCFNMNQNIKFQKISLKQSTLPSLQKLECRLPIFNKISKTFVKFDKLQI